MSSWLVYSEDGQHLGPVPTEYVARAVKSGAIPANRWVTEVDRTAWRPLAEVPEIRAMLEGMAAQGRARENTVIAMSDAFPSFPGAPGAPVTQKEPPSSDQPMSSERTIVVPAAFEAEMAEIANPTEPRPAAGGSARDSARDSDLDVTLKANAKVVAPEPYGATLRSPDGPVLPQRGGGAVILEPNTAKAPAAAWQAKTPSAGGGAGGGAAGGGNAKAPVVEAIVNPSARVQTPLPRSATSTRPPAARGTSSNASSSSGTSVLGFFLGGLALGAVVVVAILIWAFRGGVLR